MCLCVFVCSCICLHECGIIICASVLTQINGSLLPVKTNGKTYFGLLFGSGDEWRLARHTVSPAFSARKIKLVCLMHPGNILVVEQ